MRGSNINYCNKKTGHTPLHTAIELKLNSKVTKFLLKSGANPHVEDYNGQDCCDKATHERYQKIKIFKSEVCKLDPSLRVKVEDLKADNDNVRRQVHDSKLTDNSKDSRK